MNNLLQKLASLKENEQDPFLESKFEVTLPIAELTKRFTPFSKLELEQQSFTVRIAGRVMRVRNFGSLCFAILRGFSGDIQLVTIKNKEFRQLDIGDIIGVVGVVCKTEKGELSVKVSEFTLLSKCLKPIPDFHYGFTDIEERFRNRHLDFIVNKGSRDIIVVRSRIITALRSFLDQLSFVEVETPILVSDASGAQAKPFKTYHNKLSRNFNLRIATEIPLKKLLVGGFEKVYEIGRVFRNEGIDARHNPEFTTVEIYEAYQDANRMMELTESIFNQIANKFFAERKKFTFNGHEIQLGARFERISMIAAINKFVGVDFTSITDFEVAKELAIEHKVQFEPHHVTIGHIIALFFERFVEERLIQPTFVYDYPIETSPLAKCNRQDKKFASRFELFISGLEFANGYSELNDAEEQRKRFEEQIKEKTLGNDETAEFDHSFVEALEYGMPPAGGLGIGIDRMIMFFNEQDNIREVVAFPQMKKKS